MKTYITLSAMIMLFFCSCMGTKKNASGNVPATSLYETKWSLKKIYSETGSEDVSTKAFIKFNQEKNSAGGNGSCNSFGSTTKIEGTTVSFSNIFSTKMYCEAVQKTENMFLKQLALINRFEISGTSLQLFNDKNILLEFIAE